MLSVLIVDDDVFACNRIAAMIDWAALGMRIAGYECDGEAALRALDRLHPDILLTDVAMPRMNGLELSAHVARMARPPKMLILSSYDDYEYMRTTFRNGAIDFLLKDNLNESTLMDALGEIKRSLASAEADTGDPERQIREGLLGCNAPQALTRALAARGLGGRRTAILLLRFALYDRLTRDMNEADRALQNRSMRTFIDQLFAEEPTPPLPLIAAPDELVLLCDADVPSQAELAARLSSIERRAAQCMSKYLGLRACPARRVVDGAELHGALRRLRREQDEAARRMLARVYPDIVQMYEALIAGRRDEGRACLRAVHEADRGTDAHILARIVDEALTHMEKALENRQLSLSNLPASTPTPAQIALRLTEPGDCLEALYDACAGVLCRTDARYSGHVARAVSHIRAHFREPLNLSQLACVAGLSDSYFSTLFAQETGVTVTEFIARTRVQEADRLLRETDLNIKEIYHRAGFNSYNYFFRVYKQVTGKTPVQGKREGTRPEGSQGGMQRGM